MNKSIKQKYFEATQKVLRRKLDKKIFDKAWAKAKREAKWLTQGDMEHCAREIMKPYDIGWYYKECEEEPTGRFTLNRGNDRE